MTTVIAFPLCPLYSLSACHLISFYSILLSSHHFLPSNAGYNPVSSLSVASRDSSNNWEWSVWVQWLVPTCSSSLSSHHARYSDCTKDFIFKMFYGKIWKTSTNLLKYKVPYCKWVVVYLHQDALKFNHGLFQLYKWHMACFNFFKLKKNFF